MSSNEASASVRSASLWNRNRSTSTNEEAAMSMYCEHNSITEEELARRLADPTTNSDTVRGLNAWVEDFEAIDRKSAEAAVQAGTTKFINTTTGEMLTFEEALQQGLIGVLGVGNA
jgi:hypothetical protein